MFQAFTIHRPSFDGVIFGDLVDPFAELDGAGGVDLEAHCDNGLEAVMVNLPLNLSRSLSLNY